MLLRTLTFTLILGLTLVSAVPGEMSPVDSAAAMCYLDPDDPVPGVSCGVNQTVNCVKGAIKDKTCPV